MGISEDLKELIQVLKKEGEEVKEKKFKFPFGKKVGRSQRKKNYVTVLLINDNSNYEFKKYQINNQTILHEKIPRLANAGYVMFDKKGNPLVILPNWSVESYNPNNKVPAFNPKEHYEESLENGSNINGYAILLANMEGQQIKPKAQMGGLLKWLFIIGILAVIGYAFISGG